MSVTRFTFNGIGLMLALTLASSAWAECAWVLWRHGAIIGERPTEVVLDDPWRVIHSSTGRTECESERAVHAKRDAEFRETPEAKRTWKDVMGEYADKAKLDVEFLCLPDTVDPRGPKASER